MKKATSYELRKADTAITYREKAPTLHFLAELPTLFLNDLASFLDINATIACLQVDKKTRQAFYDHVLTFVLRPWRQKLQQEFSIPTSTIETLQSPHLAYQRLSVLANHTDRDMHKLYKKMRYVIADSEQSAILNPWLFFPYTPESQEQFKAHLEKEDKAFREYYLDLATQVGNLALVQFMVEEYHLKVQFYHFRSACLSGNIKLVQYFLSKHGFIPKARELYEAAASGNLALVTLLAETFSVDLNPYQSLDCAASSGSLEVVNYFRQKDSNEPDASTVSAALSSGNLALVSTLHLAPNPENLDFDVCQEGRLNLELIDYLSQHRGYIPTAKTLDAALAIADQDLVDYLMNVHHIQGSLSLCTRSGNIEFVKGIIKNNRGVPDLEWLLNAICSGNVALVKFLITAYHLDPRHINFSRFDDYDSGEFCFANLAMAKFLIEEQGCKPVQRRFEDYIRGNNLPLARYLITECGFLIDDHIFKELNFTNNVFMDGDLLEGFVEMGRNLQMKTFLYPKKIQDGYFQRYSGNPLLRAFKMQKTYRFELMAPRQNRIQDEEKILLAMVLLLRDRFRTHSYVEICLPCSEKKTNIEAVLSDLKRFLEKKTAESTKLTKKVIIPFSLSQGDGHWQLLVLDLITQSATVINPIDLAYYRADDPDRNFQEEWEIKYGNRKNFKQTSYATVIDHYQPLLTSVESVFGDSQSFEYQPRILHNARRFSVFITIMNILDKLSIRAPIAHYALESTSHPFDWDKGGRFLSDRAALHWQAEVLGFLSLNLSRIPDLIAQPFVKESNAVRTLVPALTAIFYEEDQLSPKLITREERTSVNKINTNKFLYFKEAFLETYEFDGYDTTSTQFTPGLKEADESSFEFSSAFLTPFMAISTFFGLPTRPEKASIDEGALLTVRQIVRNFFGGWNPVKYNAETDESNIEGKVLWNIIFLPIKLLIFLIKIATIPFKIALNTIKLFTEFFPTVIAKYSAQWAETFENLRIKKVRNARHIFKVLPFLLYGIAALITGGIFALSFGISILGRMITSPEKSARMAWALGKKTSYDTIPGIIMGALVAAISLYFTLSLWCIIAFLGWPLVVPFALSHIPALATLLTSFSHISIVAASLSLIKGALVSFWAIVPEVYVGLVQLGLTAAFVITFTIAIRIADELSNAWARWGTLEFAQKKNSVVLKQSQTAHDIVQKQEVLEEKAFDSADTVNNRAQQLDTEMQPSTHSGNAHDDHQEAEEPTPFAGPNHG
jgi:hypothetical protein